MLQLLSDHSTNMSVPIPCHWSCRISNTVDFQLNFGCKAYAWALKTHKGMKRVPMNSWGSFVKIFLVEAKNAVLLVGRS